MTRLTTTYAQLLLLTFFPLLVFLSGRSSAFQATTSSFVTTTSSPSSSRQREGEGGTMAIRSTNEATTGTSTAITLINSLSSQQILDQYDTFLLDMWGVMHNGSKPYTGVLEAVKELKRAGKKMIILSNSSKRRENSHKMLVKLGFDIEDFDNIITSGDVSHALLKSNAHTLGCKNWNILTNLIEQNNMNVFVFGSGDDDESYCTSAGWTLTSIEKAHLILARGTFTINDGSTVIHKMEDEMEYWKVMEESMIVAAKKKLPMLVANPDKIRPDEGLPPMPGAIGDAYERFLWTTNCAPVGDMTEVAARDYVKRIGKPFQEVYDIALRGSDPSRAIMIGDALETDVTGASNAGVDSMWVVQDGIHAEDVNEKSAEGVIAGFNGNSEFTYAYGKRVMPNYVTDHFRW